MKFLLALLSLTSAATAATVSSCGGAFTVMAASLKPTDPVAGQEVGLHLEYSVPSPIIVTGGTSEMAFTYNFIPFQPTSEPLCQDVPCPLGPGTYSNDTVSVWPSGLSGSFTSTMKWFDPASTLLLCLKITGKLQNARMNMSTAVALRPKPLFRATR